MMRASTLFGLGLLSAVVPALAEPHAHHGRRHNELSRRAKGDLAERGSTHTGCRFTYYATGLGSCGITNTDSDFIVALNAAEYGSGYPGPNCFKMITISIGGKTAQAQITDECPGCPVGGLDFSPGLFKYFADESAGVLTGDWWFTSDGGSADPTTSSSKWVAPTTSSVWTPDPTTSTSAWVAPTTSSTWKADPTTSSTYVAPTTSSTPAPTTSSTPAASSASHHASSSAVEDAPQSSGASDASQVPSATGSSAAASATNVVSNNSKGDVFDAINGIILGFSGLAAAGAQQS